MRCVHRIQRGCRLPRELPASYRHGVNGYSSCHSSKIARYVLLRLMRQHSDPTWIHPLESTCDILSFDCSSRFLSSVCYPRYLINFHLVALIVDALVTVDQLGSMPACNPFTQYTEKCTQIAHKNASR